MKLLTRTLSFLLVIFSSILLTNCRDDDEKDMTPKVYYAYYEFSEDMLDLYKISISVVDGDFETLQRWELNTMTPYKANEKNHTKSFLIKCDATGKRDVMFQATVKSNVSYGVLDKSEKEYNLVYGYSFYQLQDGDTEEEAMETVYYSCYRTTLTITGVELGAVPETQVGLTKYESIISEIENASFKRF